jgi:hypothetical protein
VVILAAAQLAAVSPAFAQFSTFHVGNRVAILDETGTNNVYGRARAIGCLVQIIKVVDTNNPYLSPFNVDATVNTGVTLIANGETSIGNLTSPAYERLGLFGRTFSHNEPQPATGSKIFVRVFNAWNQFDASYYVDSDIKTFNGNDFIPVFGAMTNLLSATDTDGDGLHDRWEQFLGTDLGSGDSDGDGVSDQDEHRAGTSGTDAAEFLVMSRVDVSESDVTVTWPSVVGKEYQVECTENLADESPYYVVVGPVVAATSSISAVVLPGAAAPERPSCAFRVVLVETPIQ